jgi:micrococcal nuclease
MNSKQKQIALLAFLIILLITINYSRLDNFLKEKFSNYEMGIVERIIDGDTLIINGTSIRLLGINTPEKGEQYYSEAKEFLEMIVLNKTVELIFGKDKTDRYGRTLAYIFYKGENVNLELVDEGFANYYFFEHDSYYSKFKKTWEKCIKMNKNLCEKSINKCADCIKLKNFNHKKQLVIFENICNFDCDLTSWDIKDEGRKHFEFPELILEANSEIDLEVGKGNDLVWEGEKYVWTGTGDTLFLRDSEGKLVLWESY